LAEGSGVIGAISLVKGITGTHRAAPTFTTMNVLFSMIQGEDIYNDGRYSFYENNPELIDIQRIYAKKIGADYLHFRQDFSKISDLTFRNLPSYHQYIRFVKMNELSRNYDKVVYLDVDVVPISSESIFDNIVEENVLYSIWMYKEDFGYCRSVNDIAQVIGDNIYKYSGHTNFGVMGSKGVIDIPFDPECGFLQCERDEYIGLEHAFMYLAGKNEVRAEKLGSEWNTIMDGYPESQFLDMLLGKKYKMLHFSGASKNIFKEKKKLIMKTVERNLL